MYKIYEIVATLPLGDTGGPHLWHTGVPQTVALHLQKQARCGL